MYPFHPFGGGVERGRSGKRCFVVDRDRVEGWGSIFFFSAGVSNIRAQNKGAQGAKRTSGKSLLCLVRRAHVVRQKSSPHVLLMIQRRRLHLCSLVWILSPRVNGTVTGGLGFQQGYRNESATWRSTPALKARRARLNMAGKAMGYESRVCLVG